MGRGAGGPIGRGYRADMLSAAPLAGRADWRQAFRMQRDRELPLRAVQRFGGRVFGRSQQAFHGVDPMPVGPIPFRKGEHELPGFVEGSDYPAVGEGEEGPGTQVISEGSE